MPPATDIDTLIGEYLRQHPALASPGGDQHPAVLAIGAMKPWLMVRLGGPLPYWQAMVQAAKVWFASGEPTREFRIFCNLFEAEGRVFWKGVADFQPLTQDYADWRKHLRPTMASARNPERLPR